MSDAACFEDAGHVSDPFSAGAAPTSSQSQERGPEQRDLSTPGQPSQCAAPVQQPRVGKALSAPNAAELDRQRALQGKVLLLLQALPDPSCSVLLLPSAQSSMLQCFA